MWWGCLGKKLGQPPEAGSRVLQVASKLHKKVGVEGRWRIEKFIRKYGSGGFVLKVKKPKRKKGQPKKRKARSKKIVKIETGGRKGHGPGDAKTCGEKR